MAIGRGESVGMLKVRLWWFGADLVKLSVIY